MKLIINPRVIEQLGKELITSDEVALVELIKNSYDAGADNVSIHFIENKLQFTYDNLLNDLNKEILFEIFKSPDNRMILIEDDGSGMNLYELQEGFFTIGTDIKKKNKQSGKTGRRLPLGEKGIGRLATQRLSRELVIETTSEQTDVIYVIKVKWETFINHSDTPEIIVKEYEKPKGTKFYTRLWFNELNVNFDRFLDVNAAKNYFLDQDLNSDPSEEPSFLRDDLQSSISFLMSPFEDMTEPFNIQLFYGLHQLKLNYNDMALKLAEHEHKFKLIKVDNSISLKLNMLLKPWYIERVHQSLTKDLFNEVKQSPAFYNELLLKYKDRFGKSLNLNISQKEIQKQLDQVSKRGTMFPEKSLEMLDELLPIEGKVYSFKRDGTRSTAAVDSAVSTGMLIKGKYTGTKLKAFLNNHNGVKLYRGNCRIGTLGDKDNDWLQLQQSRTKGQQYFRFDLANTVGYVSLNDPYQNYIKEISSRLDLMQNSHSVVFKETIKIIFYKYFYEFSRSAYYITKDILTEENLIPTTSIDDLKKEVDKGKKIAEENKEHLANFNKYLSIVSETIKTQSLPEDIRQAYISLTNTSEFIQKSIHQALVTTEQTNKALEKVEQERKLIELETYNNYKLMANGLITEVITHELHSILSNLQSEEQTQLHFKVIEDYLIDTNSELYVHNFSQLKDRFLLINNKMIDMMHFYSFLEKTFLYKGDLEDFEVEELKDFYSELERRLFKRLKKNKINFDYSSINIAWEVPRGALIHVFYNLVDNSIYWIGQRKTRARHDKTYTTNLEDKITIRKIDGNTLHIFDTGTGVFKRFESTLFHPLVSGKASNGRGMGLYIVKKLLNSFGANIELLPERNEYGNRFIFEIQLHSDIIELEGETNE